MKIRYIGATDAQVKWGNNKDPREVLVEGDLYEVDNVEVHSWHTKVALKGIEGWFNSVSFIDPDDAIKTWLERDIEAWAENRRFI